MKNDNSKNKFTIRSNFELPDHKTVADLDALDRAILEVQQEDIFFSYAEFAKKHNVTEATIRNRIKRLKSSGVMDLILVINPYKIGYNVIAIIGINIKGDCSPDEVKSALIEMPEITSIMTVTGRFDLIIEYVCPNLEEYRQFVSKQLRNIPGISYFESFIGLDLHKKKFELGIVL